MTPASDAVRIDWQRRVAGEYAVSAFAQDFALRLTMFGAPPELIEQALQMAIDELAHATDAAVVAAAAGATRTPAYDPGEYADERDFDPALNIVIAAVPSLCLGEVLALRVQHHMRSGATVPVARAAFDRIVRDEPRHAALGWAVLDWLLDSPHAERVHARVQRELPRWFASLRASHAGPEPMPYLAHLDDADRTWGVVPVDEVRAIFDATVEADWIPRLARRGFAAPRS